MDDTLKKLEEIAEKLDDLSTRMNDEARVMEEELANRKRLGLEGSAAVAHYNEWMDRHGMGHLKVPYLFMNKAVIYARVSSTGDRQDTARLPSCLPFLPGFVALPLFTIH